MGHGGHGLNLFLDFLVLLLYIVVGVDSDLSGDGEADLEADLEAHLLSDLVGDVEADLAGDPGSGCDCGGDRDCAVQVWAAACICLSLQPSELYEIY